MMKFLPALFVLLLPTLVLADGPPEFGRGAYVYQPISYRSELQEFRAWKAAQRKAVKRRAAQRKTRAAIAVEERRLRKLEARYAAEERRRVRRAAQRRAKAGRRERVLYAEERRRVRVEDVEAEENYVRHVTAKRCQPAITAHGKPRTTQLRARRDARLNWVAIVVSRYTADYANPNRALNARYSCDPVPTATLPIYTCRFRAAPCRGEF